MTYPQYPAYIKENKSTLPAADLKRYQDQYKIVAEIVGKFEEPGAESEMKGDPDAQRRNKEVVALVAKMNECGAPPKELMGEMPAGQFFALYTLDSSLTERAGMEVGPDGVPAMPEGCTIC